MCRLSLSEFQVISWDLGKVISFGDWALGLEYGLRIA